MNKLTVLVLLSSALASCATTPEPRIVVQTETVEIPIDRPIPCLTEQEAAELKAQRPLNIADEPEPTTLTGIVGSLRAKIKEWEEAYYPTVEDVVRVCSTLPEVPDPPE